MNNLDLYRSQPRDTKIKLHGREAFEGMRKAGQLAAAALDLLTPHVVPGVTTERLDELATSSRPSHGAIPAPLNYRGFPKAICTSINHVVCHGIPGRQAAEGGRHRQHRRHPDPRRLARRHEPHVRGRPDRAAAPNG